ncbi:hypothetical protein BJ170DRAFT_685689 [Xylariales sp. AK1849]|nr:hypothetical protein BJ170DRAFT_685689 [Xylariales sp. AK1849]
MPRPGSVAHGSGATASTPAKPPTSSRSRQLSNGNGVISPRARNFTIGSGTIGEEDDNQRRTSTVSHGKPGRRVSLAETVEVASRTWITVWGPRIMILFLIVPALYTYRMVADDVSYAFHKAWDQAWQQYDAIATDWKQAQAEVTMNANFELNLTSHVQPLWAEYTDMLVNTDYERWFVDARDAEDAITAMYNALPEPVGHNAIRRHTKVKGLVDLRMAVRKRAEVLFENFLNGRLDAIKRMLEDSRAFQRYVHTKLTDNEIPSNFQSIFAPNVTQYEKSYEPQNETAHTLNYAALALLEKLVEANGELFVMQNWTAPTPLEVRHVLTYNSSSITPRIEALRYVEWAEDSEHQFLNYLRENSAAASLWKKSHSLSLRRLKRKLYGLEQKLNRLEVNLVWLNERLNKENEFEYKRCTGDIPTDAPVRLLWVQSVDDLTQTWTRSLGEPLEALLWAERRRGTLEAEAASSEYEKKELAWKLANCGATTCFETAASGKLCRFLDKALQGLGLREKRKPVAKAPIESLGDKQDALLSALNEKRCCGVSAHNEWLDLLKYGATDLIYQHPWRAEQQPNSLNDDADEVDKEL